MKVFLDMDGVLVDFVSGANECVGLPKDTIATRWNWVADHDRSFNQVNEKCTIEFWENLDWMPDGLEIERAVRGVFVDNDIYLLTTPMPHPGSWTGKMLWIKEHMPWVYKKVILSYVSKSLFAGPDTLLIDDKDENIEEFRVAGGQGILVPRPWNKDAHLASQTLGIVKRYLEDY